jgi:hypothetical protein
MSALRADAVEGCHYFFEIDFLLLGHAEDFLTPGGNGNQRFVSPGSVFGTGD